MKGYLLDTNIAIIGLVEPERLPARLRKTVERGAIYLSVLSYWEVLLKSSKGKLDVGEPRVWWAEALDKLGATPLPLRPDHVSEMCNLPPIHQDPFDRALIGQASSEGLTIVTTDRDIARYASKRLQVLS